MNKSGVMLSKAIVIAAQAHEGQFDKGGSPYILHPLTVMNLVDFSGFEFSSEIKEAILCAAVLHDVIEDTKITYADLINQGMSQQVIGIVRNVTKTLGETFDEYKIRVMSSMGSLLVKEADLTHNSDIKRLKGISDKDIQRMAKYHQFYMEIQQCKKNIKTS
jgi:guanosine-3',5'-bis(diphosphate) 3'-pyrophosphohydrolase